MPHQDEFAEVVDFAVHFSADQDACHRRNKMVVLSGSGRGIRRRREDALEEMPCQSRVVAVLQNPLHQLPRFLHHSALVWFGFEFT